MTEKSASPSHQGTRLTPPRLLLMLAAAVLIFGAAYAVGGIFGRDADDKLASTEARGVPALAPSGTPLVALEARAVAFDTASLSVPAGQPVQVRIDNEDAGIFHNLAVYRDPQASDFVQRGTLFIGPAVRDYHFAAFAPGLYYFQCDLHPAMTGTLVSTE